MKRAACALVVRFNIQMDQAWVVGVSRKDNLNAFGLPGGKCEEGESAYDAAKRELFEETGIIAHSMHPVFSRVCEGEDDYDSVTFMVESYDGEPTTQPGEGVCRWIMAEELLQGPFAEYNRKLLEATDLIQYVRH